ncbi:unnamed protein product [Chrysoparadoxa australica]
MEGEEECRSQPPPRAGKRAGKLRRMLRRNKSFSDKTKPAAMAKPSRLVRVMSRGRTVLGAERQRTSKSKPPSSLPKGMQSLDAPPDSAGTERLDSDEKVPPWLEEVEKEAGGDKQRMGQQESQCNDGGLGLAFQARLAEQQPEGPDEADSADGMKQSQQFEETNESGEAKGDFSFLDVSATAEKAGAELCYKVLERPDGADGADGMKQTQQSEEANVSGEAKGDFSFLDESATAEKEGAELRNEVLERPDGADGADGMKQAPLLDDHPVQPSGSCAERPPSLEETPAITPSPLWTFLDLDKGELQPLRDEGEHREGEMAWELVSPSSLGHSPTSSRRGSHSSDSDEVEVCLPHAQQDAHESRSFSSRSSCSSTPGMDQYQDQSQTLLEPAFASSSSAASLHGFQQVVDIAGGPLQQQVHNLAEAEAFPGGSSPRSGVSDGVVAGADSPGAGASASRAAATHGKTKKMRESERNNKGVGRAAPDEKILEISGEGQGDVGLQIKLSAGAMSEASSRAPSVCGGQWTERNYAEHFARKERMTRAIKAAEAQRADQARVRVNWRSQLILERARIRDSAAEGIQEAALDRLAQPRTWQPEPEAGEVLGEEDMKEATFKPQICSKSRHMVARQRARAGLDREGGHACERLYLEAYSRWQKEDMVQERVDEHMVRESGKQLAAKGSERILIGRLSKSLARAFDSVDVHGSGFVELLGLDCLLRNEAVGVLSNAVSDASATELLEMLWGVLAESGEPGGQPVFGIRFTPLLALLTRALGSKRLWQGQGQGQGQGRAGPVHDGAVQEGNEEEIHEEEEVLEALRKCHSATKQMSRSRAGWWSTNTHHHSCMKQQPPPRRTISLRRANELARKFDVQLRERNQRLKNAKRQDEMREELAHTFRPVIATQSAELVSRRTSRVGCTQAMRAKKLAAEKPRETALKRSLKHHQPLPKTSIDRDLEECTFQPHLPGNSRNRERRQCMYEKGWKDWTEQRQEGFVAAINRAQQGRRQRLENAQKQQALQLRAETPPPAVLELLQASGLPAEPPEPPVRTTSINPPVLRVEDRLKARQEQSRGKLEYEQRRKARAKERKERRRKSLHEACKRAAAKSALESAVALRGGEMPAMVVELLMLEDGKDSNVMLLPLWAQLPSEVDQVKLMVSNLAACHKLSDEVQSQLQQLLSQLLEEILNSSGVGDESQLPAVAGGNSMPQVTVQVLL